MFILSTEILPQPLSMAHLEILPQPLSMAHFVATGILPEVIHHGNVHRNARVFRLDGNKVTKAHLSNT